jgi:hypothetical protein
MAHIKLLDPFKKELRDMVVYTLAEFGATSVMALWVKKEDEASGDA